MSDERNELASLSAIEMSLGARLAHVRRTKQKMKRELVESGKEDREVTDHAVLRYLERHKGIDIATVRRELATIAAESVPAKDKEHHWHPSGVMLVLGDDGRVITVLSPEQSERWMGRKLASGDTIGEQP